jgi:primary-amine oxidase
VPADFEPLSEEEITVAVALCRGHPNHRPRHRYLAAVAEEPPKAPESPPARRAELVLVDRDRALTSEVVVDLGRSEVVSWTDLPGCQASYLLEEFVLASEVTEADPRWVDALRRRGVGPEDQVQLDPWPAGHFGHPGEAGRRLMRVVPYLRHHPEDNGYAHPIEGLVATVDVTTGEVVSIADDGPAPIPAECSNYAAPPRGDFQTLKPLEINQPDGAGFAVEGYRITWQHWRLGVSMHPVDGLTVHDVAWDDGTRRRTILRRAGLAEMVVPYGDPGTSHRWKNAFDSGELALGRYPFLNSLKLGCDCLGQITYLDAVGVGEGGDPVRVEQAICIHEEDYGILWKHTDLNTFSSEVRRSRRLVVSSIHTVGNYEYGFYWYFYLDGTIAVEVKLTGILQTRSVATGADGAHATLIAPGLGAPFHQHLFCFRLDLDLDGPGHHRVEEVELVAAPADAPGNELGGVLAVSSTPLRTEREARRRADPARGRVWKVTNRSSLNRLGQPVGYKLVPGPAPTILARPGSAVADRAAFAAYNLWVTPYDPAEMRAAGYPVCAPGGQGLPRFTAGDRPVEDTDVVVWYTFGVNHIPRPEDWPVMPVEYAGFSLVPSGFFDRNPTLDVPPNDRINGHCH